MKVGFPENLHFGFSSPQKRQHTNKELVQQSSFHSPVVFYPNATLIDGSGFMVPRHNSRISLRAPPRPTLPTPCEPSVLFHLVSHHAHFQPLTSSTVVRPPPQRGNYGGRRLRNPDQPLCLLEEARQTAFATNQ